MTHAPLLAALLLAQAVAPARPPAPALDAGTQADADDLTWDEADSTYASCDELRLDRHDQRDVVNRSARGWLWPKPCGAPLGWAGSGTMARMYAFAFSRDSKRFVSCEAYEDCRVMDLATGHTVERVTPDWTKDEGLGASPVEKTPRIAKLFERLGVSPKEVAFPYAKDILVSWYLEEEGRALHVTFADRATGTEREVLRFPKHGDLSEKPIAPESAWLSPDGSVLAFRVSTTQGGSGIEVGLVNVHAEAAALYRQVARNVDKPQQKKDALARAEAAEARSKGVARVLP